MLYEVITGRTGGIAVGIGEGVVEYLAQTALRDTALGRWHVGVGSVTIQGQFSTGGGGKLIAERNAVAALVSLSHRGRGIAGVVVAENVAGDSASPLGGGEGIDVA